ncbi:MAG TPA: folylpolyglutamate synthase/dihydrofolate synthase family protein [Acetomicrobium sp.]|nr:folylpolyglutamate synthase/dihydrofolate synthase family protein [Acetomicrobium sp.]
MADKDIVKAFDLLEQDILNESSPGIRPGLSRIAKCLNSLGNPQRNFKAIHVLGTNGKGSTASTLASILTSSGLKTALYTSPHLIHMGERLRINGSVLSPQKWCDAWHKVKESLQVNSTIETRPTAFELMTAISFLIMANENVDVAVVEAGMGGRLDATNLLGNVILSVFTSISLDHTNFLGDTLSQIASEKFAAIRPKIKALYVGGQANGIEDIFVARCKKTMSEGHLFSRECVVRPWHISIDGVVYDLWTSRGYYFDALETRLAGAYQIRNTATAAFGAVLLMETFPMISHKSIREGLLSASWAGRFEVLRLNGGKIFILDGAHNPEGMEALATSLKLALPANETFAIIMAMMKDKNVEGALRKLADLPIRKFICTEVPNLERSMSSQTLAAIAKDIFPNSSVQIEPKIENILTKTLYDNQCKYIVICGSLYLLGAIKKMIYLNEDFLSYARPKT